MIAADVKDPVFVLHADGSRTDLVKTVASEMRPSPADRIDETIAVDGS
jgi:hypothetical protein